MKNKHSRATLMSYSKSDLVEYCLCLENNREVLRKALDTQYYNCMKMIDEMKLFNKSFVEAKSEI